MYAFRIQGIPGEIAREVRSTGKSPEYGHAVVREVARGTGPCRSCLGLFQVGEEERLLFTYRPASADGTLGAPGPVFIHADECPRYDASRFPEALRSLPLLVEARACGGRILATEPASGSDIEVAIERLLSLEGTDYLFVRHGEAGCHIARLDPVDAGVPTAGHFVGIPALR